jgi:hypothetical protein
MNIVWLYIPGDSMVKVFDKKTIGLISLLSSGEKYISSYFLRHINSDVGIQTLYS